MRRICNVNFFLCMLPLTFEQPQIRIDNSVWAWLSTAKLETMRLSTETVFDACHVSWEKVSGKSRMVVSHEPEVAGTGSKMGTVVKNLNTAKDFKEFARGSLFGEFGLEFVERVYLVTFADLKTYVFTYNVSIPSLSPLDFVFEADRVELGSIQTTVDKMYLLHLDGSKEDFSPEVVIDGDTLFCAGLTFSMRTILSRICLCLTSPLKIDVCVLSTGERYCGVGLVSINACRIVPGWAKWPTSTGGLTTVQSVDMKRFLDPAVIASDAVNLNIKLIKWRLIPGIEPAKMSSLKFLLVGAGTLGCAVARCLISWGVSNITFVDSGTVSYSNPSRQWLYTLADVSAPKAVTAAMRLKEILPLVNAKGVDLSIPLPGHVQDLHGLEDTVDTLRLLVEEADVVFMLTDSRESRWLPSMLVAASSGRVGVSVALGFDSYLVKVQSVCGDSGPNSACYFCNDVSAPFDSTSFRTLDQQCTVTRPGLAAIASCTAVELVATMSQVGFEKPRVHTDTEPESLLGATPDQIRGFLGSFTSFPAVTESFPNCVCCSKFVTDEYKRSGVEMIKKVINDANYLMEISKLDEINKGLECLDLMDFTEEVDITSEASEHE